MTEMETPTKTIEARPFYELMQAYRHSHMTKPGHTMAAYKEVIKHVDDLVNPLIARVVELRNGYADAARDTNSDSERENMLSLIAEIDAELQAFEDV